MARPGISITVSRPQTSPTLIITITHRHWPERTKRILWMKLTQGGVYWWSFRYSPQLTGFSRVFLVCMAGMYGPSFVTYEEFDAGWRQVAKWESNDSSCLAPPQSYHQSPASSARAQASSQLQDTADSWHIVIAKNLGSRVLEIF